MISSLAQEIEKWIAEQHGVRPKSVKVPKAVFDACNDDARRLGHLTNKIVELKILGIPVLVDPTLTIGKIDP